MPAQRIAYRQCLDTQKARRRRPAESLDAMLEKGDGVLGRLKESPVEPGGLAELLAELPEEYRTVLVLRESQGFRYDEIAAATGLAEGTVKVHLFRALDAVRKKAGKR